MTQLAALGETYVVLYRTWTLDIDELGLRDADIMYWFCTRHGSTLYDLPIRSKRARVDGLTYCLLYVERNVDRSASRIHEKSVPPLA